MVYTDGSEYRGGLVNGVKHGFGSYVWPKTPSSDLNSFGHIYIGQWKNGMMQGDGKFQHREGHVIEPIFNNNLAQIKSGHFVNPLLSYSETQDYLNRIERKIQ